MSLPEEYDPIARELHNESGLPQRSPSWWGPMLSSLVFALRSIDQAEVKYVTALLDGDQYEFAAFTSSLLVLAECDEATKDDADFKVTVYPLNRVESVGVRVPESAFGDRMFSSWPGKFQVEVKHLDAGTLLLPFSSERNARSDAKLESFVPELVALVGRRT